MGEVRRIYDGRNTDGRFAVGNPGGPGRAKGSKHRLAEDFLRTLVDDFREHGAEAIAAAREADPMGYMRTCAALVPKEFTATVAVDGGYMEALRILGEREKAIANGAKVIEHESADIAQ